MRNLKRHLRGLLVAIAALTISASAVFAATVHTQSGPADAAALGLKNAAEAARATVPSQPEKLVVDADDEEDETVEDETVEIASEHATRPMNHGWFVSLAAKAATPAGFDNHGAYVSSIAKGDLGKPATANAASDPGAKGQAKAAAAKAKAAADKAARQP